MSADDKVQTGLKKKKARSCARVTANLWRELLLCLETFQLRDERFCAAFAVTHLLANFLSVRVQRDKGWKAFDLELGLQLAFACFNSLLWVLVWEIQSHQHQIARCVIFELLRGKGLLVKFYAPDAPVRAGEIHQHHFVLRLRLRQRLRQIRLHGNSAARRPCGQTNPSANRMNISKDRVRVRL